MVVRSLQSILAAVFSVCMLFNATISIAQEEHGKSKKEGFKAAEVIFDHILDNHDFHLFDIPGENGEKRPVSIPLPVILYSPESGFSGFMSSKFHHGHETYEGYRVLDHHFMEEHGLDKVKTAKGQPVYNVGTIYKVDSKGMPDLTKKVYDFSLTRNVVQMMLALAILVIILLRIAKKYRTGAGVKTAPKGSQNLMEPVITFVRDEVAKPNLGHKADKYLPYLLTVFFFILINNIFGLIPGSANVTGNIAFTVVLGLISFVVILFSSNKHYWLHIFNPPGVPLGIKFILVPVEFLSLFIKPVALIIRLFANMVAGHIIIICLISLIFIFAQMHPAAGWGSSLISVAFTIFIYFIEVLVAFLQAFIFTMLTAVFIGQAIEGVHHEGEAAHH